MAEGTVVKTDARAAQAIDVLVWRLSLRTFATNARWSVDEACRSGSRARIALIGSTAKGSATNITILLSPKANIPRSGGSSFACFASRRDASLACALLRLALAVRALCAPTATVIFRCDGVPAVALAIARASRSISVRSRDRLSLAREAAHTERIPAGIETPSGSSSPPRPNPLLQQLESERSR